MARTSKKGSRARASQHEAAPQIVPLEEQNIIDVNVSSEMETSFLEYAYSVIYSRALPDARDGMKPVQRRILYMMSRMGLRPEKGHVKSARVVGEVMGKLHPHGDSAIYDAMVRLAQPFSQRLPLVDGHGNFGSLDDGPAASRYTEAKMTPAAVAMTSHLDENVVDFVPNYDNQLMQPDVLPAAFPNLLVNGASGIAVGMATNMAPHNLREVVRAAQHLLQNPEADLKALMKFVPGPDLPSGGKIVGLNGIRDAYAKGRGSFKIRATVSVEQVTARKTGLVVTALPYGVGPEKVIEKLKDAVNAKKVLGVSDVMDLTDRKNGLKMIIELKSGFNPQAVLTQLYKHTPLEESFGINNVALVNGQPRTMGLVELLSVYVDHRLEVIRRRTQHRLDQKRDRLHLVEGLLLALVDIDRVIEIIRNSDDTAAARQQLIQTFDLSESQANHILELRLRQLTRFSRIELEAERDELAQAISELEAILGSDEKLREVVSAELDDVAEQFGDDRRTQLLESEKEPAQASIAAKTSSKKSGGAAASGQPDAESLMVADTPCWVIMTASGQLARTVDQTPLEPAPRRRRHDAYRSVVATTARGEIGALMSTGRLQRVQAVDIPTLAEPSSAPNMATGVKISEYFTLNKNEKVIALVPLTEVFAIGTQNGVVKRVKPEWPLNSDDFDAITLKGQDQVIGAAVAGENDHIVFITRQAQLLHYPASLVRPQGRHGSGVAGIKVGAKDSVLSFNVATGVEDTNPDAEHSDVVVTVTDADQDLLGNAAGSAKVTPLADYPPKGRGTAGVRAHRLLKGETQLRTAWAGPTPPLGAAANGVARSLPIEYGRRDGAGIPLDNAVELIGAGSGPKPDTPETGEAESTE